jgi:hypothetical protein
MEDDFTYKKWFQSLDTINFGAAQPPTVWGWPNRPHGQGWQPTTWSWVSCGSCCRDSQIGVFIYLFII